MTGAPVPRRVWPWVVVLCGGVLLGVVGVGVFVAKTVTALESIADGARFTPSTFTLHCETGTYDVYQAGAQHREVQPSEVRVTGPGGQAIATTYPATTSTQTTGGVAYLSVVSFATPSSGVYVVRVDTPGTGAPVLVAVGPSLLTGAAHNLEWIVLALLGLVPFLLGVVMTIVRASQRSRRRSRPQWPARCANGHAASPTDRFCATCGAAVYPSSVMVQR